MAERPIAIEPTYAAWARANLFASPLNTAITTFLALILVWLVPKLFSWAILNAVFTPDPTLCRATKGACWGFIVEKFRLMTFATYPYEQQWRPLVVIVLLLSLIGAAMNISWWGRKLLVSWAIGVPLMWVLMRGGTFGPYLWRQLIAMIVLATVIGAVVDTRRWGRWLWVSLVLGLPLFLLAPQASLIELPLVETEKWGGLPLTLILAANGIIFSFPLAILLALGRRSELPIIRALSVAYIEIVRGVPLITVLFMASLMIPLFLPEGITVDKLLRAQIGFILFAAAYEAEVVRGGLQAIPKGQFEAADALGLTYWHKMGFIILPQALKLVIPPMVNTFIGFFKDTSLVIIIGLFDLLGAVRLASSDVEWRQFYVEGLVFVALVYFAFCYAIASYSKRLEARLNTTR